MIKKILKRFRFYLGALIIAIIISFPLCTVLINSDKQITYQSESSVTPEVTTTINEEKTLTITDYKSSTTDRVVDDIDTQQVTTITFPKTNVTTTTTTTTTLIKTTTTTPDTITKPNPVETTTIPITDEIEWIDFNCSAYCTCVQCTGGGGITASGTVPKANWTIAASRQYPFGTLIYIEGYGTYCVEDRGGAINNNKIDIYFGTHSEACNFGRRYLRGYVVRMGYGNGN